MLLAGYTSLPAPLRPYPDLVGRWTDASGREEPDGSKEMDNAVVGLHPDGRTERWQEMKLGGT